MPSASIQSTFVAASNLRSITVSRIVAFVQTSTNHVRQPSDLSSLRSSSVTVLAWSSALMSP